MHSKDIMQQSQIGFKNSVSTFFKTEGANCLTFIYYSQPSAKANQKFLQGKTHLSASNDDVMRQSLSEAVPQSQENPGLPHKLDLEKTPRFGLQIHSYGSEKYWYPEMDEGDGIPDQTKYATKEKFTVIDRQQNHKKGK